MNKRIQQLAEQAEDYATAEYEKWIPTPDFSGIPNIRKIFNKKFAEMIVKECANLFVDQKYMILNPHEPFANERVRALKEHDKDTVRKIRKHFGVEE